MVEHSPNPTQAREWAAICNFPMSEMGLQELVRLLTLYLAAGVEVGAAVIVSFAAGRRSSELGWVSSSARARPIPPRKFA